MLYISKAHKGQSPNAALAPLPWDTAGIGRDETFASLYDPDSYNTLHSVFHHRDTCSQSLLLKHAENVSLRAKVLFRPEVDFSERIHVFPLWLCFLPPKI